MVIVSCKFLVTHAIAFNLEGKTAAEFFADYAGDNGLFLMDDGHGGSGYRVDANFVCFSLQHARSVINTWFDRLEKDCGGYHALRSLRERYLDDDSKWSAGMTIGIASQMAGYSVVEFKGYTATKGGV